MFFAEKIKSIKPTDRVLEIGPGTSPHKRSDVFLEKKYDNDEEFSKQVGHNDKFNTSKQVIFYEGDIFPFTDNEFDYVICSHVLEHVDNVEVFLSEIFRVSNKGYFEYPLIYYDYLYNFNVHTNFLKFDGETLYYKKKSDSSLNEFSPVQLFFVKSLQAGHNKMITDLLHFIMEGFEWNKPFKICKTQDLNNLILKIDSLPEPSYLTTRSLLSQVYKKTLRLIKQYKS